MKSSQTAPVVISDKNGKVTTVHRSTGVLDRTPLSAEAAKIPPTPAEPSRYASGATEATYDDVLALGEEFGYALEEELSEEQIESLTAVLHEYYECGTPADSSVATLANLFDAHEEAIEDHFDPNLDTDEALVRAAVGYARSDYRTGRRSN